MGIDVPHDGESPRDPQSETVGAPHRDDDPPVRTTRTPLLLGLGVGVWIALGVAMLVVALVLLLT